MKDIIIIGAGPGGYELALKASKSGLTTLLIEKDNVGGTCLNYGCIPTKSYYQNAKILNEVKKAENFGITGDFSFDFNKTYKRKEKVVSDLIKGIEYLLNKENVEFVKGTAKIVDKNTVQVNNAIYKGKNIVIATGSSSVRLNLPGFDLEGVIDSTDLLSLQSVPEKLVIIGGGVIGIEMATIFATFGSEVEVIEMCDTILPLLDLDISKRLQSYLKQSKIKIHTKSKVTSITKIEDSEQLTVHYIEKEKEETTTASKVLLSIGRKPNLDNLGLDEVGIAYSKKGIVTDDNFKTNIDNIYAIGDVTGKTMLAHSATYSGYHVLNNILGVKDKINFNIVPSCVFTFPEIASIGLTEEEAKNMNIDYKVSKSMYRASGKAVAMNEVEGFIKVIVSDDKIIGVHIIGYDASNLISQVLPLINENISIINIKDYIFAHPTLAEIFANAIHEL